MKKFLKLLVSLVTLVFTVFLVAVFTIANLDPNEHKDWIAGKFEESTGLPLELNGNIGLTLYPWFGVTLEDFAIGNAPGFSATPLLAAQRAELRVKLLPALNREYEIDTIHLSGARILLETNAAGIGNWQAAAPATTAEATGDSTEPFLNNLVVGGVDISGGALTFDDRFNDVRYDLTDITVSTGELVYGEPVDLSLGLNASTSRPALSALVNLSGTIVYDLDNERYDIDPLTLTSTLTGASVPGGSTDIAMTTAASIDFAQDSLFLRDFSLSALDARVNANINGAGITGDDPLYQANLAAAGNDLSLLFRILENDDLVRQIAGLDSRAFRVSALVESRPNTGSMTVSGLDANLLDATITGDLSALNLQGNPVVSGTLNASGPDLPTLLEVAGQFQGGRNSELARYGRELQQSPDQSFLVNTRFDANLDTGNIQVPALEVRVLGATINGAINASNINSDTPVLRGNLNASGPDLPLMLQIAGQLTGGRDSVLNTYGRQLRGVGNRNFTVTAPFDVDMATGNIDISGLDVNTLGFRLNGSLQARNFQAASGTMSGSFTLNGRNLGPVLRAIEQPDLADVVQSVVMDLSVSGTRSNLRLNPFGVDLVLSGPRIPNSPVTLALNTNAVLDLEGDTLRTDALTLAGLGLNLTGTVNASQLSGDLRYTGQVALPQFNLRRFMQQLNQELPPTTDNTVFQSVALSTDFAGSNNDMRLSNLDITLDESRITGEITVANLAASTAPATSFDFDINRINLDRYLAPATDTPAASEMTNTELPVDTLRDLNLKGELAIGQITYSGLNLSNMVLNINAADGRLALAPLSASLYAGSYTGDIRLDVTGDMPLASVDTDLTGINLGPLLQDFMDASYLSGTGNVRLALTGRGADTATIKRNLNGSGSLSLQDGALQGVDVGSVLTQVESMIREQRARTVNRGQSTPFESFSADIAVNNGIVSTRNLLIDSSGFGITGSGTLVNLADDSIAFNLVASVDENPATDERAYDLGGYRIPIACSGTLASPSCLPDLQAILASAITSAVQRGLTNLLERAAGAQQQPATEQQPQQDQAAPQQEEEEEAPADPREELLNRALESIFNRR